MLGIVRSLIFGRLYSQVEEEKVEVVKPYGPITEEYAEGMAKAIAEELRSRGYYVTVEEIMRNPHFREMVDKWFKGWVTAFLGREFLEELEKKKMMEKAKGVTGVGVAKAEAVITEILPVEAVQELARLVARTVLETLSI